MNPWTLLGLAPTGDEREIKRAYARKLKVTRPDDDPVAYQALREAYDWALRNAQYAREEEQEEPKEALLEESTATPIHAPAPGALQEVGLRPATPVAQVAPTAPAAPAPTAFARPHPGDEARRIWTEFLSAPTVQPQQRLAKFMARDDMLDLEVRAWFEVRAAHYAATDACPEQTRLAIAEFFGWEEDAGTIARFAPDATHELMGRLRAQRSLEHFSSLRSEHKAVRTLLDGSAPRFGSTFSASFTRQMQELLQAIRGYHPDLLYHKLDRTLFEAWEERVEGRRYFVQTFLYSLVCGQLLWYACSHGLTRIGRADLSPLAFVLCYLASFALLGWFALREPAEQREGIKETLAQLRYHPLVLYGWMPLLIVASSAMYIPEPGPVLTIAVSTGLVVAMVVATFANTLVLAPFHYVIATIVAFSLGSMFSETDFSAYGRVACIAGVLAAVQLLYRGGADLFDRLGVPDRLVLPLRAAWYVGAVALLLVAAFTTLPPALCGAALWLWACLGMLLSAASILHAIPLFGGFVAQVMILPQLADTAPLKTPPLPLLFLVLVAIAIFMGVNIQRSKKNHTQFS